MNPLPTGIIDDQASSDSAVGACENVRLCCHICWLVPGGGGRVVGDARIGEELWGRWTPMRMPRVRVRREVGRRMRRSAVRVIVRWWGDLGRREGKGEGRRVSLAERSSSEEESVIVVEV